MSNRTQPPTATNSPGRSVASPTKPLGHLSTAFLSGIEHHTRVRDSSFSRGVSRSQSRASRASQAPARTLYLSPTTETFDLPEVSGSRRTSVYSNSSYAMSQLPSPVRSRLSSRIGNEESKVAHLDVFDEGERIAVGVDLEGRGGVIRDLFDDLRSEENANPTFEIVRRLGEGTYAIVYLVREVLEDPCVTSPKEETRSRAPLRSWASDLSLSSTYPTPVYGRSFALKCLSKQNLSDDLIEVQRGEAFLHRSLPDHEYIARMYGALETDEWLFLILEYCPGQDLFYWLDECRDDSASLYEYQSRSASPFSTTHHSFSNIADISSSPEETLISHSDPDDLLSRTVTADESHVEKAVMEMRKLSLAGDGGDSSDGLDSPSIEFARGSPSLEYPKGVPTLEIARTLPSLEVARGTPSPLGTVPPVTLGGVQQSAMTPQGNSPAEAPFGSASNTLRNFSPLSPSLETSSPVASPLGGVSATAPMRLSATSPLRLSSGAAPPSRNDHFFFDLEEEDFIDDLDMDNPSILAETDNRLSPARVHLIASMFIQMCSAVQACHDVGVSHRDIKPENFIVVDRKAVSSYGVDGDYSYALSSSSTSKKQHPRITVKITDWGLGTQQTECEDFDCGSKPYMAYECRNNLAPAYDPRKADVWSLGLVLLNLLYHRNPWWDPSPEDEDFRDYCARGELFFLERFEGIGRRVASFLANRVFCDVISPRPGAPTRATARELGEWAAHLAENIGKDDLENDAYVAASKPEPVSESQSMAQYGATPVPKSHLDRSFDLESTPLPKSYITQNDTKNSLVFTQERTRQPYSKMEAESKTLLSQINSENEACYAQETDTCAGKVLNSFEDCSDRNTEKTNSRAAFGEGLQSGFESSSSDTTPQPALDELSDRTSFFAPQVIPRISADQPKLSGLSLNDPSRVSFGDPSTKHSLQQDEIAATEMRLRGGGSEMFRHGDSEMRLRGGSAIDIRLRGGSYKYTHEESSSAGAGRPYADDVFSENTTDIREMKHATLSHESKESAEATEEAGESKDALTDSERRHRRRKRGSRKSKTRAKSGDEESTHERSFESPPTQYAPRAYTSHAAYTPSSPLNEAGRKGAGFSIFGKKMRSLMTDGNADLAALRKHATGLSTSDIQSAPAKMQQRKLIVTAASNSSNASFATASEVSHGSSRATWSARRATTSWSSDMSPTGVHWSSTSTRRERLKKMKEGSTIEEASATPSPTLSATTKKDVAIDTADLQDIMEGTKGLSL